MRVIVGDSKQAIETFMYSKNYDVIVIGYEKVCFSTVFACCRFDIDIPCVQVREHVELLKAAQPPIGLVICDEGALLEQHLYPLSRKLTRLVILQDIASSRTRPRRARPCNRCPACAE